MTTGLWDIITPEAGTNLVYNPAANITGNLTAIGAGTVSRVTTYTYIGPGCHRIQASADNTGGYFTIKAAANAIHYVTLRIHTSSDVAAFDVSMDNSNWNDMTLLSTEGSWWVYGVQIPAAQANASVALRVQQKGAGAIDLYIGFVQVEQNTYPTTPISGDLVGYSGGYAWEGSPNASASTRSAQERAGGKVVDLRDTYGVIVGWSSGIGLAPMTHHTQAQALLPGMRYTGFKVQPRVIDLISHMGTVLSNETVHSIRKDIIDALDLDGAATAQPVKLRYRGALSTKPVEFNAVYDAGLSMGSMDVNGPEETPIRLICYDPYAYEVGEASAQLTTAQDIADADYVAERINGAWSNISTAFNGNVTCFAKAANGNIYIGGSWSADVSTAGDGYGIGLIEYNPTSGALTSLGGAALGGTAAVYGMAVAPNGDLYITGDFLNAGGVAAADYCAMYDLSAGAFVALSTGLGALGRSVAIGQDGSVYFGGDFTNLVDANGDGITKWNGTAFSSMSTGVGTQCFDIEIAPNGTIYAVAGGNKVVQWTGSAWTVIGTTNADVVFSISTDKAGNLYAGGGFATIEGVGPYIAKWNGVEWSALGTGTNDDVLTVFCSDDGLVYISGAFTTAGGITAQNLAVWNGYTWTNLDIVLPTTPGSVYTYKDDTRQFVGYGSGGTAVSSYLNTITNNGTARAYPVVHIKRAGGTSTSVRWLKNETTGATIYLDYDLLDGEELTLDFRLGQRKVTSSFFGSIWRAVLRGSDFSSFYLQRGTNQISAYVYQVGSPTMTQYMTWTTTHTGADGAAA